MKRIKNLFVTALFMMVAASASAQTDGTFQFVDKDGNVVPDGSTCTFDVKMDDDWGMLMAKIDLFVKNTTAAEAYASLQIVTEKLPNGSVQVCFPDQCVSNVPADFITGNGAISAGSSYPLNSEWIPVEGKYGTAELTIQLRVMEQTGSFPNFKYDLKATGPKIKVNCVYADPTGISGVTVDGDATVNVYDVSGKTIVSGRPASALGSLGKGLYICETVKDGKRIAIRKIVK